MPFKKNRITKVLLVVSLGIGVGLVSGVVFGQFLAPDPDPPPAASEGLPLAQIDIPNRIEPTGSPLSAYIPGLTKDLLIAVSQPRQSFTELWLWENDAPGPRLLTTGEPVSAWMYSPETNQILGMRNDLFTGTSSLVVGLINQPLREIATGLTGSFPPGGYRPAPTAEFLLQTTDDEIHFASSSTTATEFTTSQLVDQKGELASFLGNKTHQFGPSASPACTDFSLEDRWVVCDDPNDSQVAISLVGQGVDGTLSIAFYQRGTLSYQLGDDPSLVYFWSMGGVVSNIWMVNADASE